MSDTHPFLDRRQPSGDLATWDKAKDAALIAFLGMSSVGLIKLMIDVSELKTSIAVYQSQQEALKTEVGRIRLEVDQHFRDDRTKFTGLVK